MWRRLRLIFGGKRFDGQVVKQMDCFPEAESRGFAAFVLLSLCGRERACLSGLASTFAAERGNGSGSTAGAWPQTQRTSYQGIGAARQHRGARATDVHG